MTDPPPSDQRPSKLAYIRWKAAAPAFDWSVWAADGDWMPQPLSTGREVAAAIAGPGVALFLNEFWSIADAVVACSVLASDGVLPYLSEADGNWPVLVHAEHGSRAFTRCTVDGCTAPTYVQRLGSGRAPVRCVAHAPRHDRVVAALGKDRETVRRLAGRALIDG